MVVSGRELGNMLIQARCSQYAEGDMIAIKLATSEFKVYTYINYLLPYNDFESVEGKPVCPKMFERHNTYTGFSGMRRSNIDWGAMWIAGLVQHVYSQRRSSQGSHMEVSRRFHLGHKIFVSSYCVQP